MCSSFKLFSFDTDEDAKQARAFVPGKFFHAGLVFAGIVGISDRHSTWVCNRITCKCKTSLERLVRYNTSSLLDLFISDGEESWTTLPTGSWMSGASTNYARLWILTSSSKTLKTCRPRRSWIGWSTSWCPCYRNYFSGAKTISITTLSIKISYVTLSKSDIYNYDTQNKEVTCETQHKWHLA